VVEKALSIPEALPQGIYSTDDIEMDFNQEEV
jgi:hypothetical protein